MAPRENPCLTDLWVVIFFKMQYPLSKVSSQISGSSVGCFAEELCVEGAVSSTTIKERITSVFFLQTTAGISSAAVGTKGRKQHGADEASELV